MKKSQEESWNGHTVAAGFCGLTFSHQGGFHFSAAVQDNINQLASNLLGVQSSAFPLLIRTGFSWALDPKIAKKLQKLPKIA